MHLIRGRAVPGFVGRPPKGRSPSLHLGGNALGLSSDEQSFYDALAGNPSARKLMQDQVLATMAKELAEMLRWDVTIDWQFKENVRARLRVKIKTLLKRYNYPPDAEKKAIDTVLQQAEVMGEDIIAPLLHR